ncbi:S41 family peptidase [Ekhidna sp. To15]|uniref:S41 family peptidase n=1 Tax=Ekhidna sp. To15 TaxID=3395267 RepID=UPI003F526487
MHSKKLTLLVSLWILHTPYVGAQSNKPVETFEACWNLFDESYASFEEKGIDWHAAYREYKPQVNENTTDRELFIIITNMLKPLGDAHVNLIAKNIDTAFSADRYSRVKEVIRPLDGRKKPYIEGMMDQTLYDNGFEEVKKLGPVYKDDTLFTYTRTQDLGYLRFFRSFSKLAKMVGPSLDSQLDQIFGYFNGVESIIIDVRFNMGGDDAFSQKIAGRFVEEKKVGFKKQTRRKHEFGSIKEKYIKPEGEPFLGKVILLTNDQTFSAADVLALMMASVQNATIIGEPSNGSYSDLYGKKLPNGWRVTLSNQRYYSTDMKNYEGKGTSVDIEVQTTLQDINSKSDSVLEAAIAFSKRE